MKNFQALKILFLLLLMVSFTTQTTKATTDVDTPVYLNDGYEDLIRDLYCEISRATLSDLTLKNKNGSRYVFITI